jgi:Protein of unknown function (DUF4236)
MGFFRFRRSFRILPGVRLNVGKRSTSVSLGVRGAHVTFGKRGTRTTVSVPGTGVSYTEVTPHRQETATMAATATPRSVEPTSSGSTARGWLWIIVVTVVLVAILIGVLC